MGRENGRTGETTGIELNRYPAAMSPYPRRPQPQPPRQSAHALRASIVRVQTEGERFAGRSPDFRASQHLPYKSRPIALGLVYKRQLVLLTAPSKSHIARITGDRPHGEAINGLMRRSFPVTVAGLFRILTGFPILPDTSDAKPPATARIINATTPTCQGSEKIDAKSGWFKSLQPRSSADLR